MNSFEGLDRFLNAGRDPDYRRVPSIRATVVHRLDESAIAVRYHDTDVVTHYQDGRVTLDSGGWRTVTTKVRFNQHLPRGWNVYQERGEWYLQNYADRDLEPIPYQDDITIHPDGTVTGAPKPWEVRERQAWAKKINRYAKAYAEALVDGKVPGPSASDCFYCQFVDAETGASVGDRTHLESHIRERYYVPSLLLQAFNTFEGYLSRFAQGYIYDLWHGNDVGDWGKDIAQEQVYRLLRKYLRHQFDLAG